MSDIPSVWPSLFCTDPRAMITFLTRAFGFTERMEHVDRGIVQHAELIWTGPNGQVGGVMISPTPLGGESRSGTAAIHVVTDDPDALFAVATAGGATVVLPLEDADYGSRIFEVTDPEGNLWSFGTWYE